MGAKHSTQLSDQLLEEYVQLSYLNKMEIRSILQRLSALGLDNFESNLQRLSFQLVLQAFPEFQANPFTDRLFLVFSSQNDGQLSFEDLIDMFSALSDNCPDKMKAHWAFKVFDFDNDNCLNKEDITRVTQRLVSSGNNNHSGPHSIYHEYSLTSQELDYVSQAILDEVDMDKTGVITRNEFVHGVTKMPDFSHSFCVKL